MQTKGVICCANVVHKVHQRQELHLEQNAEFWDSIKYCKMQIKPQFQLFISVFQDANWTAIACTWNSNLETLMTFKGNAVVRLFMNICVSRLTTACFQKDCVFNMQIRQNWTLCQSQIYNWLWQGTIHLQCWLCFFVVVVLITWLFGSVWTVLCKIIW